MAQEPRAVERAPYDEPELWRVHLGSAFSDLAPEALERGSLAPTGALRGVALGAAGVFRVSGTPQVVQRTSRAVRGSPGDFLKVCVQLRGRATVHQDGREIVIEPGRLAVYDTGRPYALRLEGGWSCAVMAVRRGAIDVAAARLHSAMERVHLASEGPGLLLSQFITATVDQLDVAGPAIAGKLGDAGVCLLSGTLAEDGDVAITDAADSLRDHVMAYIDRRLADPRLSRASIAAAHRMSPRTLDRPFGGLPWSVSGYVRHQRLEAVRRDLENPALTHRSVAALAARWCFVDAAHFSRVFRDSYGFPPSHARPAASPPTTRRRAARPTPSPLHAEQVPPLATAGEIGDTGQREQLAGRERRGLLTRRPAVGVHARRKPGIIRPQALRHHQAAHPPAADLIHAGYPEHPPRLAGDQRGEVRQLAARDVLP